MPDYSHGKIYQIRCNVTGDCYIGSTCQTLSRRLTAHCKDYKRWQKGLTDGKCISSDILERNDYNITLLQAFPCDNKSELLWRERYYQEDTVQCINKNRAIVSLEERRLLNIQRILANYTANKEAKLAYQKAYRNANKETILAYQKEYRAKNKEKNTITEIL